MGTHLSGLRTLLGARILQHVPIPKGDGLIPRAYDAQRPIPFYRLEPRLSREWRKPHPQNIRSTTWRARRVTRR